MLTDPRAWPNSCRGVTASTRPREARHGVIWIDVKARRHYVIVAAVVMLALQLLARRILQIDLRLGVCVLRAQLTGCGRGGRRESCLQQPSLRLRSGHYERVHELVSGPWITERES